MVDLISTKSYFLKSVLGFCNLLYLIHKSVYCLSLDCFITLGLSNINPLSINWIDFTGIATLNGANLLSQPGGDLVGAIGKATKDPISNVGKVLEKETATDREAKLLAFKLASDRASPGETGKLIQDLKNAKLRMKDDKIFKIYK